MVQVSGSQQQKYLEASDIMSQKYLENCGFLRLFDLFDDGEDSRNLIFEYHHLDQGLVELQERYGLSSVAGQGSDWSKAVNLLTWLCENTFHNGSSADNTPLNGLAILEYSFMKGKKGGVNCRKLATVLAEACLSVGLKSRIVSLHPLNPYDADNHVVTVAWCSSLGKWVMLDPTFRAYLTDAKGLALSPWESRGLLSLHVSVTCNAELWYNGEKYKSEKYLRYISKNLFCMHSPLRNWFGSEAEADRKWIWLIPRSFDAARRNAYNWLLFRQCEMGPWDCPKLAHIVDDLVRQNTQRYVYTTAIATFSKAPADGQSQ